MEWVPVKERLPEINGVYLITRQGEFRRSVFEAIFAEGVFINVTNVIAWMPIPKPYEEK